MPRAVYAVSRVARVVNAARVARAPPPTRVVGIEVRSVVERALEMAESHSPAKLYRPVVVSSRRL